MPSQFSSRLFPQTSNACVPKRAPPGGTSLQSVPPAAAAISPSPSASLGRHGVSAPSQFSSTALPQISRARGPTVGSQSLQSQPAAPPVSAQSSAPSASRSLLAHSVSSSISPLQFSSLGTPPSGVQTSSEGSPVTSGWIAGFVSSQSGEPPSSRSAGKPSPSRSHWVSTPSQFWSMPSPQTSIAFGFRPGSVSAQSHAPVSPTPHAW